MQWGDLYRLLCPGILSVLSVPWPGDGFLRLVVSPAHDVYAPSRAPEAARPWRSHSADVPILLALVSPPGLPSEAKIFKFVIFICD